MVTRGQIEAFNPFPMKEAGMAWQKAASWLYNDVMAPYQSKIEAATEYAWEGRTADAASQRAFDDLNIVRLLSDAIHDLGVKAESAYDQLNAAKHGFLHTVSSCELKQGFIVTNDLDVLHVTPPSEADYPRLEAERAACAQSIRMSADAVVQADRRLAGELEALAVAMRGFTGFAEGTGINPATGSHYAGADYEAPAPWVNPQQDDGLSDYARAVIAHQTDLPSDPYWLTETWEGLSEADKQALLAADPSLAQTIHNAQWGAGPGEIWWDTTGASSVTRMAAGSFRTQYRDGTVLATYPTGMVRAVEKRPNGDKFTTYSDGLVVANRANGDAVMYNPDGSIQIVVAENRTTQREWRRGDVISIDPGGNALLYPLGGDEPRSITEEIQRDSKAVLEFVGDVRIPKAAWQIAAVQAAAGLGAEAIPEYGGVRPVDAGEFASTPARAAVLPPDASADLPFDGGKTIVVTDAGVATGNWNEQLNHPEPNTVYYVDDGRYVFETDDKGRVGKAWGVLEEPIKRVRQDSFQTGVGRGVGGEPDSRWLADEPVPGGRKSIDDGGHLIANQMGGPSEFINLIPQHMDSNEASPAGWEGPPSWYDMEMLIAKEVKAGYRVDMNIDLAYPDGLKPEERLARPDGRDPVTLMPAGGDPVKWAQEHPDLRNTRPDVLRAYWVNKDGELYDKEFWNTDRETNRDRVEGK